MSRNFSKRDVPMTNRYMRKLGIPLITRDIQTQNIKRYHLPPGRVKDRRKQVLVRVWKSGKPHNCRMIH
jgi:uncharacterized protein YraI